MATIIINGQDHTLPEGEKLNAIQAAKLAGVDIPYYCWHPALSVVANCRMCEIEVGQKDAKTGEIKMIPKLVPGCQTPAKDGTVLVTNSAKVEEHQRMIMEYLLINHPLDCPVCDQAGMCGLQDYSYEYGQSSHRFVEERTVNPKKDVSDAIQLNQDRCIMCTRCVRFTREITQTGELQVMRRGNHAEIDVFPGHPIENPLAGNVVDLCPVGALLDKDFLHKQRAWFLSKHDAVCTRCSTGCNIKAEENRGQIWRFTPRNNPLVNDYWICDEGRASYKSANDPNLLTSSYAMQNANLSSVPIDQVLNGVAQTPPVKVVSDGGKIAGVLSPSLTVEEAFLMATYLKELDPNSVLALGPVPVVGADWTITPDQHKGRTGDTSFVVPRPVHDPRREGAQPPRGRGRPPALPGGGDPLRRDLGPGGLGRVPVPLLHLRRHRCLGRPRPRPRRSAPGSSIWSSRTRRSRRWPRWPTRCSRARRSPRRRAATSTPTAGSSMPTRRCPRATGRCRTSTSSPS